MDIMMNLKQNFLHVKAIDFPRRIGVLSICLVFMVAGKSVLGQNEGAVLLVSGFNCQLLVDGQNYDSLKADIPKIIRLPFGQHIAQGLDEGGVLCQSIFEISDTRQIIVNLEPMKSVGVEESTVAEHQSDEVSKESSKVDFRTLADVNLTVNGSDGGEVRKSLKTRQGNDDLYFALAEGDVLSIQADLLNKRGKFFIQVLKYPEWTPVLIKQDIDQLPNTELEIDREGIYVFRVGSPKARKMDVHLQLRRQAGRAETSNYSTEVSEVISYEVVSLAESQRYYLNSLANATFKGGRTYSVVSFMVPYDVEKWYYSVAASRDQNRIDKSMETFSLLRQLTSIVGTVEPTVKAVGIGLEMLGQPPGSDYIDVFLTDGANAQRIVNGLNGQYNIPGSRQNVASATIDSDFCRGQTAYVIIKNRDNFHGVHVSIEAAAVVKHIELVRTDQR